MSWTSDVLHGLEIRDEIEKRDSIYFTAFKQLSLTAQKPKGDTGNDGITLHSLISDKDVLINKMNTLHFEIQKLEEKLVHTNKLNRQLEKETAALKGKITSLTFEIAEKNKAIETINDELLSCNIQNNILSKTADDLTEENESLVQRWMERVKLDAEKLNDANELVQGK
ncbi:autophagy protein 16, interacts with Atg12p-Atg5p [Yamadazyma tenuis]|uniref:Autophagy protein 16 n=1 Tax=Candida tenuis (strain ATCC 10573 / BCRC 21748 / CBS 615 / JCM 9827 / NBRC 10315 / NRRL Y-1498 / VKM Y-70) TaxID=590646 RepID=G3B029_CANTC|nr:autophagy protein 16 [Yamadazyma tenuis ATCC 10573]EGV65300.1 autophagy protein 16 [Yamadazyma tenuis ATCC 10573]WEJ95042.1 autophagy protein 16, interacts with Atg12p-Atg5p [Yamadazyma tenuis]